MCSVFERGCVCCFRGVFIVCLYVCKCVCDFLCASVFDCVSLDECVVSVCALCVSVCFCV